MFRFLRKSAKTLPDSVSLYLNHIPRTAGTSLRSWLNSFFSESQRCPALHQADFQALPPRRRGRYLFYAGHLQNAPWQLVSRNLPAMTVLREPRQHFSSLVTYYTKEHVCRKGASDDEVTNESTKVLESYLYSEKASQLPAVNMQTKWLAGLDFMAFLDVSGSVVAEANATYRRSFLVGIVERMQETIDLLAWHRGWPHEIFDIVSNTTPSKALLNNVDTTLIDDLLKHDIELYQKASERLDGEMSRVFGAGHCPEQRAALINAKARTSNELNAGLSL